MRCCVVVLAFTLWIQVLLICFCLNEKRKSLNLTQKVLRCRHNGILDIYKAISVYFHKIKIKFQVLLIVDINMKSQSQKVFFKMITIIIIVIVMCCCWHAQGLDLYMHTCVHSNNSMYK